MNEDDLAGRIVERLDQRLAELPSPALERLGIARRRAVQIHHQRSRGGVNFALDWLRGWVAMHGVAVRMAVPALLVVVTATAVLYMQSATHHEGIDVEASLLADDLPIHAYTDPGFDAWLKHTAHEQE